MSGLSDLYQEILLEHNSKPPQLPPRWTTPAPPAEGYNPLCGDQITLYLKVVDDVVEDVGFQGIGCAISRASASMMTQSIKGRSLDEATGIFEAFHSMITHPDEEPRLRHPRRPRNSRRRQRNTPLASNAPYSLGTPCAPPSRMAAQSRLSREGTRRVRLENRRTFRGPQVICLPTNSRGVSR